MRTIAAGKATFEAVNWLLEHGAAVDEYQGLQMIELPSDAQIDKTPINGEYTISFNDADGNLDDTYVVYDLETDAYETSLELRRPRA